MPRGYGRDRNGRENVNLCVAEVPNGPWNYAQCSRRRGHGPDGEYCTQHAKRLAAGRPVDVPVDRACVYCGELPMGGRDRCLTCADIEARIKRDPVRVRAILATLTEARGETKEER